MRLKDTKRNAHLIEDQTALSPKDKYFIDWLSKQPSSQSGLTRMERDQHRAGASVNDLYFTRAATNDYDLIPNQGAQYSGGQLYDQYKKIHLKRVLDMLMQNRNLKR